MSASSYISSMRRESIRAFFEASPTAKLLRSDFAPWVIDFLNQTFKSGESISIGQTELRSRLSVYQEELHETEPDLLTGPPERYVAQWTEAGWLQRFLESASIEPQFQLSRFAEAAIRFIDTNVTHGTSLVGTESRLRLVIETLEDIVRGASADPDRRLNYLREQRAQIEAEIEAIQSGKSVQVYRPSQIRDRFQTAVNLLKDLQSDFRAVEERFQGIARDVQQLQASGSDSRGGILGFALDAEDMLKTQDEGISFYAFVAFLFSPAQQAALVKTIQELQQLTALHDQSESMQRVRRMVPALLAEADKVMRTTARLSTTLRRLLDARAAADRVRLANVLCDIRQAALRLGQAAADPSIQLSPSAEIDLNCPMSRTFWSPAQAFTEQAAMQHAIDGQQALKIAAAFARLQRLDFRQMRSKIRESMVDGRSLTLVQLVERHPVQAGVVELLGYLQIAHDDGHSIDSTHFDRIVVHDRHEASPLSVSIPHITFTPKARHLEIGKKPR
ncbi:MAG: DUF3375 domain-containing protein [Pirellulaceae bacterium]|nr:DUF3375 domain-containing protein [Pirellulaceae bacterium]